MSAEILTYEDKKQEYEAYLKDYDIKNNNCTIKAGTSGIFTQIRKSQMEHIYRKEIP